MNVADLRPWEYWAMDSCEYAMITDVRAAWFQGIQDEQEAQRKAADVKQGVA